jgi:hypothetical protein
MPIPIDASCLVAVTRWLSSGNPATGHWLNYATGLGAVWRLGGLQSLVHAALELSV